VTVADEKAERRLELKVGAFALVVLLLGAGAVLLLGRERHVFESRVRLSAAFREVSGLRPGAPVWLSGVNVGTVTRVAIGRPGAHEVLVELEVQRAMLDRIRRDSVASIGTQGLLGDKLLQISIGSPDASPLHAGDALRTETPADFNRLVDQANDILIRAKEIADNIAEVSKSLADPRTIADFRASMASLRSLLAEAQHGQGLMHAIFYDQKTAHHFERLASTVDDLIDHVDIGVKKIDSLLATTDGDGRQLVNNISRAAKQVADVAAELQRTRVVAHVEQAGRDLAEITGYVKSGRGTLGALIADPTVYEQLVSVLGGVQRSRILRALVRYAISRDEGRSAAKEINTPLESKTPSQQMKPPSSIEAKTPRERR